MWFYCIVCGKLEKEEYYLQEVCNSNECKEYYRQTIYAIKGDRYRS